MSKLFEHGATLVLQIIFVVAAVLVFSWFDPFSLLAPTKLTLKNTPIQVQSIREIGQLITAEYYGEVISSSLEVKAEKVLVDINDFDENISELHDEFVQAVETLSKKKIKARKGRLIYQAFAADNPELLTNPLFASYLNFVNKKLNGHNYNSGDFDNTLKIRQTRLLLKSLYNSKKKRDKVGKLNLDEIKSLNRDVVEKVYKKSYRRGRLVMIGRGWVKTGFDFREFTDRNFRYDKTHKQIHFIGLQPQIISATINPWFIPEEGIEGFEFLIAERHARLNPHFAAEVKTLCLNKLKRQAMDKQILVQAQKNAETNLKSFFSLLLDEDIERVKFHTNYLNYTLDAIVSDSVLRDDEIFTVDSAITYFARTDNKEDKCERISDFISSLKSVKSEFYGIEFNLNSKSSLLFSLIKDRVIDSLEVARLESGYYLNTKDTIWNRSEAVAENSELITNVDLTMSVWDMEKLSNDLIRFIQELPVEVIPMTEGKCEINVKTGEKSFSTIHFKDN